MKSATIMRLRPNRSAEVVDLADAEAACRLLQRELFVTRQPGQFDQLAAKTGLCRATVSNIAYGDTKQPRFSTVVRLLMALGWAVTASR